jgi:general secretion pathway protein E
VCRALAQQFGLQARESIEINEIEDELVERLPIQYARSNTVLPYRLDRQIGLLRVFAADPLRLLDLDDLCQVYGTQDLEITLMPRATVLDLINRVYARRTKDVDLEKRTRSTPRRTRTSCTPPPRTRRSSASSTA